GEPRPCGPLPRSARIRPCRHVQSRRGTRPVRGCVPRMLLPGLRIFACVPSPLLLRRCCLDGGEFVGGGPLVSPLEPVRAGVVLGDRKSTRLNSSHVKNSYAVFCLKKKRHKTSEK